MVWWDSVFPSERMWCMRDEVFVSARGSRLRRKRVMRYCRSGEALATRAPYASRRGSVECGSLPIIFSSSETISGCGCSVKAM